MKRTTCKNGPGGGHPMTDPAHYYIKNKNGHKYRICKLCTQASEKRRKDKGRAKRQAAREAKAKQRAAAIPPPAITDATRVTVYMDMQVALEIARADEKPWIRRQMAELGFQA